MNTATNNGFKKGDLIVLAGYYGGMKHRSGFEQPVAFISHPVKVESWGTKRGTISITVKDDIWRDAGEMSKCAVYNASLRVDYFASTDLEAAEAFAREETKKRIIKEYEGTVHCNASWMENYYNENNPKHAGFVAEHKSDEDNLKKLVDSKAWETCELVRVNLFSY